MQYVLLLRRSPASDQNSSDAYFVGGRAELGAAAAANVLSIRSAFQWNGISCAVVAEPLHTGSDQHVK